MSVLFDGKAMCDMGSSSAWALEVGYFGRSALLTTKGPDCVFEFLIMVPFRSSLYSKSVVYLAVLLASGQIRCGVCECGTGLGLLP